MKRKGRYSPEFRQKMVALARAEAELRVFEFIEGWYNPHRRHSSLDYQSPLVRVRKKLFGYRLMFKLKPVHRIGATPDYP